MKQWVIAGVGLAAICAALLLQPRAGKKLAEQTHGEPFAQLGEVLAEETLRAVPGKGRIAVVRYRLTAPLASPVLDTAADAFLRAIRRDGRLQVAEVIPDEYNPLEREGGWASTLMASSRFRDLIAQQAGVDALVLIGGTPTLDAAEAARLPARPKIIAASVLTPPAPWLLTRGILAVAVVPRAAASQDRTPPRTDREWFDRRYEVLRGREGAAP